MKKGGRISYGVVGTFDSLNPFILKSMRTTARGMWDPEFGNLVYESLMVRSRDEAFTMYGLLAESVEWDDDRSFVEFHLNPKARWADGKPVLNANDEPRGILHEYHVKELSYHPFGRDLLKNKLYQKSLSHFVTMAPIADLDTPAEQLLDVFTGADPDRACRSAAACLCYRRLCRPRHRYGLGHSYRRLPEHGPPSCRPGEVAAHAPCTVTVVRNRARPR